ncbi:MAG TPA: TolC family protein [Fimbriiglobus sp.]|nr:TolC family protein [Fimbriiglobus sp.]
MLLFAVVLAGCTRSHYRRSADAETYPIIRERVVVPAFDIGRTRVEPAAGSRLADPFDPDHPPKPPDDPSAALFMARPGGMRGSSHWGKDGYTDAIEPPGWERSLGLDEKGTLKLTPDKAVELALLNSREYQTTLEDVYIQALALTLNRFEFDCRWFLRNNTTFTHFGTSSLPNETNTLGVNTDFGFNRNFAAGGQLLVDFANALTYEYTGGTQTVRSNAAISLIQPLLRNAGRKVRLETLTQAERDVLYTVRQFARFRKAFWASVAVGGGGTSYLDLLRAVQSYRNAQLNLKQIQETYGLYNELFRGGRRSVVELDQFYQQLQQAQLGVISAELGLQNALDGYKLQLGVPPRIPVELDDSQLDQFVLTDPVLEKLREDLDTFQRERLRELGQPPPADALRAHFATLRGLAARVPAALEQATADLAKWGRQLDRPTRPGDDPDARSRARSAHDELEKQLPAIAAEVTKASAAIDRHQRAVTDTDAGRLASWTELTQDIRAVLSPLDAAIAIQTQSRIYLIELPEVEAAEADALAYAKTYRLDLQNQLGAVTDAWRKVTVAANALRSGLDVVAKANLVTEPGRLNPVAFSADASQYSIGLQFDGPLNRQAERNAYRLSLITYQRAKRGYMQLSDRIEFAIRQDLRGLRQQRVGFEVARQSLLSAARQFENERINLFRPQQQQGGATTLNLLQALSTLLNARNSLAGSYFTYEQQRVQLLLDLEALQLDQRGFPINASARTSDRPAADEPPVSPERLPEPRPVPAAPGRPGGP